MTDPDIEIIRRFVAEHVPGVVIADEVDIFASGYVNSLFALQLVLWVERIFHVTISARDLDIDNFRTIAAVAALVAQKRFELHNASQAL